MTENYVYKKEVDWSLFNYGFAIPLEHQVVFKQIADRFIGRGESQTIQLYLNGNRYEQNDDFFVRMFSDPDMMQQVMDTVGSVLYERLKKKKGPVRYEIQEQPVMMVAEDSAPYGASENND